MGIIVITAIIAVIVTLAVSVPVTANLSVKKKTEKDAETIGTAEVKARGIIDEALKTAETKKREALLEAKEENLRTKNELEKETKERRAELQKYEKRVVSREEALDKKADAIEKREADYSAKEAELKKKEKKKLNDNNGEIITINNNKYYKYSSDKNIIRNSEGEIIFESPKNSSIIYSDTSIMSLDSENITLKNIAYEKTVKYKLDKNETISNNNLEKINPYKNTIYINSNIMHVYIHIRRINKHKKNTKSTKRKNNIFSNFYLS